MCRSLVSVAWQGCVYDCDFNQQLGLPIRDASKTRLPLIDVTASRLADQPIRVADDGFGCTAGQVSSCGGAFAATTPTTAAAPGCGLQAAAQARTRRRCASTWSSDNTPGPPTIR